MFLAEGALDMVLDIVILCMPMPVIHSLRMDRKRKAAISAILSISFLSVSSRRTRNSLLIPSQLRGRLGSSSILRRQIDCSERRKHKRIYW